MKKIDIITTQNVRIEYELATLGDRFLGWLLDLLVMFGVIVVLSMVLGMFSISSDWVFGFLIGSIIFLYTLLFEVINNGQTVGKMAMKTKVMTITGKNPEVLDYVIRWSFRFVDLYLTAGSLAAILVSSGDKAQRLGGVLSNTTVVRLQPKRNLTLAKLLTITSLEDYSPRYPEIRKLSEKDMLTIKQVLDRFNRYKNESHRQAVLSASQRAEEVLDISRGSMRPSEFLKVLVQDYIVLTR